MCACVAHLKSETLYASTQNLLAKQARVHASLRSTIHNAMQVRFASSALPQRQL